MSTATTQLTIGTIEERYEDALDRLEALEVYNDEAYIRAAELAKALKATEKALEETEEVAEKKRLYKEYKKFSSLESAVKKKLDEVAGLVRAKLTGYAVLKDSEALSEQEEKAIEAAIATGDDSYLDMMLPATQTVPEVPGVTYAEVLDFTVEDEEAVPSKYKKVDTTALRKRVQADGLEAEIPGVRVYRKKQVRITSTEA